MARKVRIRKERELRITAPAAAQDRRFAFCTRASKMRNACPALFCGGVGGVWGVEGREREPRFYCGGGGVCAARTAARPAQLRDLQSRSMAGAGDGRAGSGTDLGAPATDLVDDVGAEAGRDREWVLWGLGGG